MNFVAIDFETANRYPNSACSVGLVKVIDGQLVEEYYRLIQPPYMVFDSFNIQIHGIRPAEVRNEPKFDWIWTKELQEFVSGFPLVAHNASFDMGVLRALFSTYDLSFEPFSYACTVKGAKRTYLSLPNHKLSTVAAHLEVPLRHHQALDDARACAYIMLDVFHKHQCTSFDDLCVKTGICLKLF